MPIKRITYPSHSPESRELDELGRFPYDYGFFAGVGEFTQRKNSIVASAKIFAHNFDNDFEAISKDYDEFTIRDYNNGGGLPARRIFFTKLDMDICSALNGGFPGFVFSAGKNVAADFLGGYFDAKAFVMRGEKQRIVDSRDRIRDLQMFLAKFGTDSVIRVLTDGQSRRSTYALDIYNPFAVACRRSDLLEFDCMAYRPKEQSIKFVKPLPADVGLFTISGDAGQYVIGNVLIEI